MDHSRFALDLADHNRWRFAPALPSSDWRERLRREFEISQAEILWVETLRAEVRAEAEAAPTEAKAFVKWFEELKQSGPGQNDVLFPWLQTAATREQVRWFIGQEVAGEAGFDDLLALTQVKIETRAKLEMARNYWDEMGRGTESGMHGPMLDATAQELKISELDAPLVPAAVELGNLMTALARHRQYAYHSIGALGAIELTAPTRTGLVAKALKRVGVNARGTHYFILHASVDLKHSAAWNAEVLFPLVSSNPNVATSIAEGALMRLRAGEKCFEAYRSHFSAEGAKFPAQS